MYVAAGRWQGNGASIDTVLHLVNDARVHTVETHGLRFDARFLAPVEPTPGTVSVFLLVEGRVQIGARSETTTTTSTPCFFAVGPDEFERRLPSARWFRFDGEPRRSIEICLDVARVRVPMGLTHGAQPLPPSVHAAALALFDPSLARETRVARCRALIVELDAHAICTLPNDVDDGEHDATLERVVTSFVSLFREQDTGALGKRLASLAQVSVRQATRDVSALYRRFRLPGASPRELFRVMRLRRAAILLSAPGTSLDEVAREVGYSGLDAMTRALRDAGFPPPGAIRRALLDE